MLTQGLTLDRTRLNCSHFKPPFALVRLERGRYDLRNLEYDVALELTVPVSERNLELGT